MNMETYIKPFFYILNEMSPYLLLGFFIAGILHSFVPQKIYQQHFSKNNFKSVLYSTLFGIPLPLCSCGVIPTAMSLRKNNASKGATVSFLISTPQTGIDSILATTSFAVDAKRASSYAQNGELSNATTSCRNSSSDSEFDDLISHNNALNLAKSI